MKILNYRKQIAAGLGFAMVVACSPVASSVNKHDDASNSKGSASKSASSSEKTNPNPNPSPSTTSAGLVSLNNASQILINEENMNLDVANTEEILLVANNNPWELGDGLSESDLAILKSGKSIDMAAAPNSIVLVSEEANIDRYPEGLALAATKNENGKYSLKIDESSSKEAREWIKSSVSGLMIKDR